MDAAVVGGTMSDQMYFVVTRRFDGDPSYSLRSNWPPVNMTPEVKRRTIAVIELSALGQSQSFDSLIVLYQNGRLQSGAIYRAPELPKLKTDDARANARYRDEAIGKRHSREGIAAFYVGVAVKALGSGL